MVEPDSPTYLQSIELEERSLAENEMVNHRYNFCGLCFDYEFIKSEKFIKITHSLILFSSTLSKEYYINPTNTHIENKAINGLQYGISAFIAVLYIALAIIIGFVIIVVIDPVEGILAISYAAILCGIIYAGYWWRNRRYLKISDNTGFSMIIHHIDEEKKAEVISLFI